jgi:putative PIN family toxin of toxin-antitoxin system
MRVTFDTNVLVSAFIARHGHSANLLQIALTIEQVELVLSKQILDEFEDVLTRSDVRSRFEYTVHDIKRIVSALKKSSNIVRAKSTFRVVKEDPTDDVILNTAYDGKACYIVTGDNHLLKLCNFRGIKIVNPKKMIDVISEKFPEFVFRL